jgi:hypothetical protein
MVNGSGQLERRKATRRSHGTILEMLRIMDPNAITHLSGLQDVFSWGRL